MADTQINVHAHQLLEAGSSVAEKLTDAAKPPTGAVPTPGGSSPVDAAAASAAASIRTKMASMSAKLAPTAPHVRGATAKAASTLTATDEKNSRHLDAIGNQAQATPQTPQGSVQSGPYRGNGHVFAADTGGEDKGGGGGGKGGVKGGESGETDEKGYGGSVSKGKGGTTPIHPHGDEEHHWGHPTDPHEWHPSGEPDYPHSGTFDDGHGKWEWSGPGRQGGAEGTQTHEGIGGDAKIDGWIAKGDGSWSGQVGGHQLDLSASGEFGAHAGADGAATQHGVSGQLDAFAGIEGDVKGTYHLGPVDLSLGAGGQMGYGGNAGFDFGMADDGKFVVGGSLGGAWGIGGKVAPKIAVDPKAVEGWVNNAEQWLEGLFR